METNNATSRIVRKYPYPQVLTSNRPFSNNTGVVYRTKGYKILTLGDHPEFHKLLKLKEKMLKQDAPLQPIENKENSIKDPVVLQNIPGTSTDNIETKTKHGESDPAQLFDSNERFTGDYLLKFDISEDKDLVENLLPYGEVSVLAGPGDTGKTTLYFQLSLAITTNKKDFLSRKINSEYNSVLIIDTEDTKKRIANKIQKQLTKVAPEVVTINNLLVHVTGDNLINRLTIELKHKKFDLIILDALGDLLLDEINSQTPVRQFYKQLEKLIREFNTTFFNQSKI